MEEADAGTSEAAMSLSKRRLFEELEETDPETGEPTVAYWKRQADEAREREERWAKGRRPFQNQNAVIEAQVREIDRLNAELAELKATMAKRRAFFEALAEEGIIT